MRAAIRQAISKAIVAFHQKFIDEQSKQQIKETLITYDRTLLVADPRRTEPKKCVHLLSCCCIINNNIMYQCMNAFLAEFIEPVHASL